MSNDNRKKVCLLLSEDTKQKAKKLAEEDRRSVSNYIAELIEEMWKRRELKG